MGVGLQGEESGTIDGRPLTSGVLPVNGQGVCGGVSVVPGPETSFCATFPHPSAGPLLRISQIMGEMEGTGTVYGSTGIYLREVWYRTGVHLRDVPTTSDRISVPFFLPSTPGLSSTLTYYS